MSSRERILASVRANLPNGDFSLPEIPTFRRHESGDLMAKFEAALSIMGGQVIAQNAAADPLEEVRAILAGAKLVCSTTPEISGNFDLSQTRHPRDLAAIDYAVVRACFGVAETGSVLFTNRELQTNALAYLAQHLIVLLDPSTILENMHVAYQRPELHEADYAVFHSGPSATADIEGVLIRGAQGVRSLQVAYVPRSPTNRESAAN
ncbi:MAG: LUD domain-containing protein [Pseudomonadota bacterium]